MPDPEESKYTIKITESSLHGKQLFLAAVYPLAQDGHLITTAADNLKIAIVKIKNLFLAYKAIPAGAVLMQHQPAEDHTAERVEIAVKQ